MKIGVSAFAWTADFKESHLDVLPSLREEGLSAIEVPMFDPAKLPTAQIRRAVEANGLACTVCAILPPGINPISPDVDVRKRSVEHLKKCVEATQAMGAALIGGPLYAPIGYFASRRRSLDDWNYALDSFSVILPLLDSHEITLSIEPVNRSETFFLTTAKEARALCDALDHPRVGVTLDTFHANIEEKNIAQAVRSLGNRLKHIHASENDRGLLGSGHVDFPGIIEALHDIEYEGYLMIEGFGYSPKEVNAPGFLWADMKVSPEALAFSGARYLNSLL
jgi:D-psicose/D-tagatose/L-ribulose 3-epimerase